MVEKTRRNMLSHFQVKDLERKKTLDFITDMNEVYDGFKQYDFAKTFGLTPAQELELSFQTGNEKN